jgi:5-carboxymethyl-2-hydroxymuconate isomerase
MPQLTLEYTNNLRPTGDLKILFSRMHHVLEAAGIRKQNCKSRAICLDTFHIGEGGAPEAFVHLDARILEGRSADTKREVGAGLLAAIRDCFPRSKELEEVQYTVEIIDIGRDSYFKFPEGTLNYGSTP